MALRSTECNELPPRLRHIQRASTDNLKRAARHYRRTLGVLRRSPFQHLSDATAQKLVEHLAAELRVVVQELRRRGQQGEEVMSPLTPRRGDELQVQREHRVGIAPVQATGKYELFETTPARRVLVLGNRPFVWVRGIQGEVLVPTGGHHPSVRTLRQGRFVLVGMDGGLESKHTARLFLSRDGAYEEYVVPQDLHAAAVNGDPLPITKTGRAFARGELEQSFAASGGSGDREAPLLRPVVGATADLARYLRDVDFPAPRQELLRQASKCDAPEEVKGTLQVIGDRCYLSLADVSRAVGEQKSRLPIKNYDAMAADDVIERLEGLGEDQLRRVKQYEQVRRNRKTVRRALDEKLET